jgi:hypothetical protein
MRIRGQDRTAERTICLVIRARIRDHGVGTRVDGISIRRRAVERDYQERDYWKLPPRSRHSFIGFAVTGNPERNASDVNAIRSRMAVTQIKA